VGGFVLNGRKTFTTMAPGLGFILVSASIESDVGLEAAQFLVEAGQSGLRVEETWDTVGMRATGSHDLVLDDVRVVGSALLTRRRVAGPRSQTGAREEPSAVPPVGPVASAEVVAPAAGGTAAAGTSGAPTRGAGWALMIGAVYLGIATAARDAAVRFARDRKPVPLGGRSIGELPWIQRLLGENEIGLAEARSLLFGVAEAWDEAPDQRSVLVPLLSTAKYVVTNRGVEITDRAMRIVGGAGLDRSHPVQRYFRDVRAGLHHPPMDDVALGTLARAALAGVGSTEP
jgi:alkylation response protein AidB-like acyl-CoA dehydrogenase